VTGPTARNVIVLGRCRIALLPGLLGIRDRGRRSLEHDLLIARGVYRLIETLQRIVLIGWKQMAADDKSRRNADIRTLALDPQVKLDRPVVNRLRIRNGLDRQPFGRTNDKVVVVLCRIAKINGIGATVATSVAP